MIAPRVSASLWSVPVADLDREALRLADAGLRTWHWDRADGTLGPAGGFTAAEARRLAELTGLASEAHLMLADPLAELDEWIEFCEVVVVHASCSGAAEALERVAAAGRRGALAFSPGDPLEQHAASGIDALVMSVDPGHGGATFLPESLDRIAQLAPGRERVGVDGGVTADLARDARSAGATWIVSGTALLADPPAFLAPAP